VLGRVGLVLLWITAAAAMVLDHVGDPHDPAREGTAAYGHNAPGSLELGLIVTLVELLIVWAILRPGSYRRSWGRAVIALVLLGPWLAASLLMTMHAGGIFVIHLLWVFALTALCGGLLAWSGTTAALARRR
jgi:hypothetical protein